MPQQLNLLPERYAICRLAADAPTPAWIGAGPLTSTTRTTHELSVLCQAANVPPGVCAEADWIALQVTGPLEFSAVGVLASILQPLADAAIPVFVISTFDTDYILLKQEALHAAKIALVAAGHTVARARPG